MFAAQVTLAMAVAVHAVSRSVATSAMKSDNGARLHGGRVRQRFRVGVASAIKMGKHRAVTNFDAPNRVEGCMTRHPNDTLDIRRVIDIAQQPVPHARKRALWARPSSQS